MYSVKVLVHYSCNRMWSDTKDESLSSHMFLNQSATPRETGSLFCGFSPLGGYPLFLIYKMFAMFTFLLEQRKWQLSQKFQILWSIHIVNSAQTTITFSQQHPLGWINIQSVCFFNWATPEDVFRLPPAPRKNASTGPPKLSKCGNPLHFARSWRGGGSLS